MSTAEERMQNEIDELEQENRLLRARNDRLERESEIRRLALLDTLKESTVQEPVAWRYDLAKYRENDLRGRQWAHSVFSPTKPYIDEMVRNLTPLYTTPPAAPMQEPVAEVTEADTENYKIRIIKPQPAGTKLYTTPPAQPVYDQTSLELCNICGWNTLIPGDGCLNCERETAAKQWVDLTDRQIESIFLDAGWSWGEKADMYVPAVREVLKLFKETNE